MKNSLIKIKEIISLIFFERENESITPHHHNDILHYDEELGSHFLDGVYIATAYRDIHRMLEAFKYRSERENGEAFGEILSHSPVFSLCTATDDVCMVPVPMHWSRYLIRGFDHTEHLCRILTRISGIPTVTLLRASYRFRQSQLSKIKRIQNKKDAFVIARGKKIPEIVILVDDVISTGSTANECAKVLKMAGVKKVYGLFLASNRD